MAAVKNSKKVDKYTPRDSFQVTQVIGTVSLSEHGELPPDLAAFKLIVEFDNPGTFTFPNAWGAETTVTIARPETPTDSFKDGDIY